MIFCAAIVGISTVVASYIGLERERADLGRNTQRRAQELSNALSLNVRLVGLLAQHTDVLEALTVDVVAPDAVPATAGDEALNRLVIQTARAAILVGDTSGTTVAAGFQNPEVLHQIGPLGALQIQTLNTNALSRRFVQDETGGWLFEVARAVHAPDRRIIGFVAAYFPLTDLGLEWRALAENLTVVTSSGHVVYAQTRFEAGIWPPLRSVVQSQVHGTELILERNPTVVWGYSALGAVFGAITAMLAGLGLTYLIRRRQLAAARIAELADDAARLEARVVARTSELRAEVDRHKHTADALHESQAQLIQTAKLKVLNDLASGLSHELSQPLAALEASLDALSCQVQEASPGAQASTAKAQRVTRRMGHILHNLRNFARKDEAPAAVLDLRQPVVAALEILEHEIARNSLSIQHNAPPQPQYGVATSTRVQQVVVNVLSNSIDALAQVEGGRVQIEYLTDEDQAVIQISDNGPGFADPEAARQPFFTTKEGQNSLGMGLSISSDIMLGLGGALDLGAAAGGGARVCLRFCTRSEGARV